MPGARGQHQGVVVHGAAVFERNLAVLRVDPRHLAEQRRDLLAIADQVTDGPRYFRSCQRCGPDLVQQWLEQVMIALIDDGDFDSGAGQAMRRGKAAEAGADDYDVMCHGPFSTSYPAATQESRP